MANVLRMAKIHAIIGLLEQNWSYRRIARELGVHRDTVSRYARLLRERDAKPAIPTPGSNRSIIHTSLSTMSVVFYTPLRLLHAQHNPSLPRPDRQLAPRLNSGPKYLGG